MVQISKHYLIGCKEYNFIIFWEQRESHRFLSVSRFSKFISNNTNKPSFIEFPDPAAVAHQCKAIHSSHKNTPPTNHQVFFFFIFFLFILFSHTSFFIFLFLFPTSLYCSLLLIFLLSLLFFIFSHYSPPPTNFLSLSSPSFFQPVPTPHDTPFLLFLFFFLTFYHSYYYSFLQE